MKKFIEERKRLALKHSNEASLLDKIIKEEEELLKQENIKIISEIEVARPKNYQRV